MKVYQTVVGNPLGLQGGATSLPSLVEPVVSRRLV